MVNPFSLYFQVFYHGCVNPKWRHLYIDNPNVKMLHIFQHVSATINILPSILKVKHHTYVRQAVDPHPPHPGNIFATNRENIDFLVRKSKCLWLREQPYRLSYCMSNILWYTKETTFHIFFLLFLEKLKYWKKYVEIAF